jgi:hypothetical protein
MYGVLLTDAAKHLPSAENEHACAASVGYISKFVSLVNVSPSRLYITIYGELVHANAARVPSADMAQSLHALVGRDAGAANCVYVLLTLLKNEAYGDPSVATAT